METIPGNVLNFLREQYPEGTRIQIRELSGEGREPAPEGIGTLESVNETGAFHVLWPDGGELDLRAKIIGLRLRSAKRGRRKG